MAQHRGDGGLVEVEHERAPLPFQVVVQHRLAEGIDRRRAALGRDLDDAAILPARRALRPGEPQDQAIPALGQRGDERALDRRQLGAERGVGEEPAALVAWLRHDRAPVAVVVEPEPRHGEVEAQLERPAADLRHHHGAGVLERRRGVETARSDVAQERARQERRPRHRLPARPRQLGEELLIGQLVVHRADHRLRRHLDDAAIEVAQRRRQLEELLAVGRAAGRGLAVVREEVRRRQRRRPADRARPDAVADDLRHRRALRGRGGALGGRLPHHPHAHGGVADERRHVHADALRVEGRQVAGIVFPRPRQPRPQRLERHALDELQQTHQRLAMLRADRARP